MIRRQTRFSPACQQLVREPQPLEQGQLPSPPGHRHSLHSLNKERVYIAIDYCNSLLFNMPDSQISKLQLIQNSAARLITGCRKFSHITPVLYQLHWLPVQVSINFKILLLTFQCLHDMAPTYLKELLVQYVPSRNLRSSHRYLLQCPNFSTKYGERTFFICSSLTVEHPTNQDQRS